MRHSAFIVTALLMAAIGLSAQSKRPSGSPPNNESLTYSVSWPKGLNLGQVQLSSTYSGSRLHFALSLDAGIPGFIVSDSYQSVANNDFCSVEFTKTYTHGKRKAGEKETFDAEKATATRQTLGSGAGKSEIPTPSCAKDALTFLYYMRRELGQGRVPASQTIFFGAPYVITLEQAGKQKVSVNKRSIDADLLRATIKGPSSETKLEMFLARDAVRTPVLIRVPFTVGTFSLELVR